LVNYSERVAKILNITLVTMLCLSLLLLSVVVSVGASHSHTNVSLRAEQSSVLISTNYKTLGEQRWWPVNEEAGGGMIISDNENHILNRIGHTHYSVLLLLQFLLSGLSVIALIASVLLLLCRRFLRLSGFGLLVLMTGSYFGIFFLFSHSVDVQKGSQQALAMIVALIVLYTIFHRVLMRSAQTSSALIAYASQSGSAMSLAKRFAKALIQGADVKCISSLSPQCLTRYNQVLLIASTYGEGEPPEAASGFMRRLSAFNGFAQPIHFSVLALGDRQYTHFCRFGHQLCEMLSNKGAEPILDVVEVDRLDKHTINTWWQKVTSVCKWQSSDLKHQYSSLTVSKNACLNPDKTHRHAHGIQLSGQHAHYQPGDLLEVLPRRSKRHCRQILSELGFSGKERVVLNSKDMCLLDALQGLEWHGERPRDPQQLVDSLLPIKERVYSIASSPQQTALEIVVRRHIHKDGQPGLASNYLCDLQVGEQVTANIRQHPGFHLPASDVPLILIGAGTGLAPLIGFLRHRAALGSKQDHWLCFGEQSQAHDFYYADEILQLQKRGIISELTLAWSRDKEARYVSDCIERQGEMLIEWVQDKDAHIYVCGSLQGFGQSACAALLASLGQEQYDIMLQTGTLRTDLY